MCRVAGSVVRGREAYRRGAWREAYGAFSKAARLTPDDRYCLAIVANLIGGADWVDRWADAYCAHLDEGSPAKAARCAGWLANGLLTSGQVAQGGAWLARAQEALERAGGECAEHGLFLILQGMAIAQMGQAQGAVFAGDCRGALPLFDSAMLVVTSEEVSPLVQVAVFCGVIDACQRMLELRRATEWTAVLSRWCDDQPDLVPFRGASASSTVRRPCSCTATGMTGRVKSDTPDSATNSRSHRTRLCGSAASVSSARRIWSVAVRSSVATSLEEMLAGHRPRRRAHAQDRVRPHHPLHRGPGQA